MQSRKILTLAFTAGLALCICCGGAQAGPFHGPMGGDFIGSELFMAERLADDLDLSDAQRSDVDRLMSQARDAARPLVRRMVEQHRAMRALTESDQFDEATVRTQAQQGSAAMVDLAVLHARTMHDLRALLTPEQRSKLDELRPGRRRR